MRDTNGQRVIDTTWWTLRIAFGLVPLLAGLDKFFNLLADWPRYIAPVFSGLLPTSPQAFMYLVGIIEIAAGILTLVKPRVGAWVVGAWLVAIALNLVILGRFDIAVRDIVMAIGAYALARLAEVHAAEREPAMQTSRSARAHA